MRRYQDGHSRASGKVEREVKQHRVMRSLSLFPSEATWDVTESFRIRKMVRS